MRFPHLACDKKNPLLSLVRFAAVAAAVKMQIADAKAADVEARNGQQDTLL